jgi:hypothetical protein
MADVEFEDDSPPIAGMLEELTSFLDDVAEEHPDGWAQVEQMRVTTPIEFYVRSDDRQEGRVAALETRLPARTLTSVPPVLHGLSVMVEVDRAERESGVES